MARMLAIACLVFAFAQPYFSSEKANGSRDNTIIYLDNSYSLQAKGANGMLYLTAVNQLIEKLPADLNFSLFTNDNVYKNVSRQEVANELLNAPFSASSLSPDQVELKANSLLEQRNSEATLVWISDFQKFENQEFNLKSKNLSAKLIQLKAERNQNISLDTAYIKTNDKEERFIDVKLSSQEDVKNPITVSLFNNNILLAKTTAPVSKLKGTAQFKILENIKLNAYLQIDDEGLSFDNKLFLSTNEKDKIKVLNVNDSDSDFLKKIYTSDEFDYQSVSSNQLNYNSIKDQSVLILNEISNIPANLVVELNSFTSNGNTLIIIPSLDGEGYNSITGFGNPQARIIEKRIVSINFDHPLLSNVFSERVTNFQYPKVSAVSFIENTMNKILSFEDGTAFLLQKNNTYIFTAPLNEENSNFQDSPLVVPIFYKLGLKSSDSGVLYQQLGSNNIVNVRSKLEGDQILELKLEGQRLIPEQRAYDSYVELQTGNEIQKAGTYDVLLNDAIVASISYNVPRDENNQEFYTKVELGGKTLESVTTFVQQFQDNRDAIELWKYFVAAALFFLICELMILKFIK